MKEIKLIDLPKVPAYIYKYICTSRVLNILEQEPHQIGFVSPELWYDPYEIKYLNTDYTGLNGYRQPTIYCFCARMDLQNEEASWKIYKRDNDPLLRLVIQTEVFISSLLSFAEEKECDVYLAKVNYNLKKAEIDNLYSTSSPHYQDFFQNFNEEQYIKIMSLKRNAFKYENEVRFFIIPRNPGKVNDNLHKNVLNVPVDVNMIKRITYYPANKSEENLASKIEIAKYDAERKLIRERILKAYPAANFKKSILYNKVLKVDKIEV